MSVVKMLLENSTQRLQLSQNAIKFAISDVTTTISSYTQWGEAKVSSLKILAAALSQVVGNKLNNFYR